MITVGPKEIAKVFEMKGTVMSKRGIGHIAATGSNIKKDVEQQNVGHIDD